jgi:hypothetical protein
VVNTNLAAMARTSSTPSGWAMDAASSAPPT